MSESGEYSRRDFLKLALSGGFAATIGASKLAKEFERISRENYVYVDEQKINQSESTFFPPLPVEIDQRPPGKASKSLSPEKGGYSEIYQLLIEHPFVGFKIGRQYITNVFGEGENNVSVIEAAPLEVERQPDGSYQWNPDPLTVEGFIIPPGALEGDYNGNCLFIHAFNLIPFGIYRGVYKDNQGRVFVGNKGAYRQNTAPIGIVRYPLAPNSNDELVLFGSKQEDNKVSPDFENKVVFKSVWADIVSAQEANEMIAENPDDFYVQACYPPEWSDLNSPPPGRVVMKMERK